MRPGIGLSEDGGRAVAQRSYSKDWIRKQAQIRSDSSREWLLKDPKKPATKDNIVHVTDPRSREPVPVMRARGKHERRVVQASRTDFTASRANSVERLAREKHGRDVARAYRGGRVKRLNRRAQDAVSMAIEGTLRRDHAESGTSFKADVRKRIEKIEAAISAAQVPTRAKGRGYRSTKGMKAAREELAALRKLEALTPEQIDRLFAAKDKLGRLRVADDAEKARLGIAPAAQLERARLQPYALSHMDARHVTVEEHRQLEREALVAEREARAKVDALPKGAPRAKALEEWSRVKAHRIDVSGRHPEGVKRHEEAVRVSRDAARAVRNVETKIAKLEARRKEIIGAQRVRRGSAPHNVAKGKRDMAKVERQLQEARALRKSRTADARAARQKADRSRMPASQAALRTKDGKFLSNDAIKEHMRAHGVDPDTIGMLSHKELGNAAHHKRFNVASRDVVSDVRRTGSAFERGESGFGRDQISDTAANAATTIAKVKQIDRFVNDNALLHESGRAFTAKEALETAKRLEDDQGRAYVAIRLFAARLSGAAKEAAQSAQRPAHFEELSSKLLNDRIVKKGDSGAENVALVPADQFNRLAKHMAGSGELEKLVQMLNRPFRFSVLAQPRWLAGNFIEPYFIRLPASGSGVVNIPGMAMDIARSVRTLRKMERSGDPRVRAVAAEIRAQHLGGLFLGARGASARRVMRDFEPKPGAGPVEGAAGNVMAAGSFIRNMPVVKQMVDLLQIPPSAYFKANRVLIEQWAQHASLGRSLRKDLEELNGSWVRAWSLGQKAIADAEAGLMHTATQERFMRAQHELLGKYEGFSPGIRRLVQTVAPFLPWALSAARFTFWTMPAHHTILTSLLVKTAQATEQAWEDEHKDVPPGGLKLAVRAKDGGWVDLARYTPYGFSGPIVEGDIKMLTDQFFPQVRGSVAALGGLDPFGRALRVEPTKDNPKGIPSGWQRVGIAAYTALESLGGPYWSLARRLQEKGGTPYADSTLVEPAIKPGSSHMSALRRTMDVFRETYLKDPQGAANVGIDKGELEKLKREAAHEAGAGISDVERRKLLREAALAGGG